MIYDNKEEIVEDLYKDFEYLKSILEKETKNCKDLLIQNILIDFWDASTKFCADISREME
jgi:hypothetical protein